MDAFFVSVELRRHPELRGRPVVVGGSGDRGVVAAASYEARAYGIHSALPSTRARRLCPHAVFLHGDHAHYAAVSRRVMAIFERFTPCVEPISLDEAFLDVTGAQRIHGDGATVAASIRAAVLEAEGLHCAVGVAPVKFLAKLASRAAKPRPSPDGPVPGRGVVVVPPGDELAFLHPLAVSELWGVGPATLRRLERLAVRTVGDLAALPLTTLTATFGDASGRHLHALANGIDPRPVVADRAVKSISNEETFAHDRHRHDELAVDLVRLADATAARLREQHLTARTVTIKVRFGDFRTITRSLTLPAPTDRAPEIRRCASGLLEKVAVHRGVRLLGVGVSGLDAGGSRQLTLDDAGAAGPDGTDRVVDEIRARFGHDAVVPASLVTGDGVRTRSRGDQQWGPSAPAS
jgi:DNA polymerase-4